MTQLRHARRSRIRRVRWQVEILERREVLTAVGVAVPTVLAAGETMTPHGSSAPYGMTPAQVRHAYGFDSVTFGSIVGDGSGQTIAIIDAYDDPKFVSSTSPSFASSDLHAFDVAFGLPDPVFTKVNQTGGTSYPTGNTGWGMEIALDVEWAHAVAPGASILLVEASSSSIANLFAAVNYAKAQPGVAAVSMSFGASEFSSETSYDSTFTTPSGHAGVTFLASTGDSGAPAGYPAYSPNVVAVGGTTLSVASDGTYVSESGWSSGGGGISKYESKPSYQSAVTQSSTKRTTPDVSLDANPSSGVAVYDSYSQGSAAPWIQVGGTSASSPMWAGLVAIADQGRAIAGQSSMDGATQTLPALYAAPSSVFHDITSGSNGYSAGSGYDLVTGLGSPIVPSVVAALGGGSTTTPPTTPPSDPPTTTTTSYAAAGLPAAIPDLGSVSSSVAVPADVVVGNLTVTLSLTHTYDSDLVITLTSPSGRVITLSNRNGGSGDNYTNTTFDSTASTSITRGSAPFTGTFAPQGSLGVFNGLDAKGTWTLKVSDVAYLDKGTLLSWSLSITGTAGTAAPAVVHSAAAAATFATTTPTASDVPFLAALATGPSSSKATTPAAVVKAATTLGAASTARSSRYIPQATRWTSTLATASGLAPA
ncbi:proprotein convertase P-domain-containing protein [Paludisphaera rhizosphaerae]|uniref:proprotein convertase P-domain-containing protein n=1 Tax=Paludisphaera rhizosphaerae TaxID=2711216 RepID=UPI0013EDAA34|nr:proprotein convertase P-domain-containing protein [Paludisphaera rhizosphaerae]